MKRILLLAALVVFGVTSSNAQTKSKAKAKAKKVVAAKVETPKTPAVDGAGMVFENETIDYGTIPHNADGKREFERSINDVNSKHPGLVVPEGAKFDFKQYYA